MSNCIHIKCAVKYKNMDGWSNPVKEACRLSLRNMQKLSGEYALQVTPERDYNQAVGNSSHWYLTYHSLAYLLGQYDHNQNSHYGSEHSTFCQDCVEAIEILRTEFISRGWL